MTETIAIIWVVITHLPLNRQSPRWYKVYHAERREKQLKDSPAASILSPDMMIMSNAELNTKVAANLRVKRLWSWSAN